MREKDIFMDSTRPFVVFKHENEDFILQNEQIVLNRYHREYFGETIVDFKTKSNHEIVQQFFTFLQTGKVPTVLEDQIEVFELLKEWDCHDNKIASYRFLIQSGTNNDLINERSAESILSLILRKQEEESFDFSFFEHIIIENLESYLLLSDFGHICLTILSRIFQKTESVFPISLLQPFFESCVAFHGSNAFAFLANIKFQPANSIEELYQFLSVFSDNSTYDFFSLNSNHLKELSKQFEELKQDNKEMKVFINDMKRKEAEYQQRNEELMKRLTELEKYHLEMDRREKEEEEKRHREEQEPKKRGEEEEERMSFYI